MQGVLAGVDADHALGRPRRANRDLEDVQEHPALAFRDQVGTIEDGLREPGEQVDEAVYRVARRDMGELRQVVAQPIAGFGDQVLEAAVVQVGYR